MRTLVRSLVALSLSITVAGQPGVRAGNLAALKTKTAISPTLVPESDKKFFGKDYPSDNRPPVDVFHFHHPYPAVQDSDDFDRDYVKDENSDNGEYKAQTEYDRLRHKLAKEKADVAKALAAKEKAEHELQDATKREKDFEEKKHEKEEEEKKEKAAHTAGSKGDSDKEEHDMEHGEASGEKHPGGTSSTGKVNIAADETQKAMDKLDECKKQLAEARKALKDLMEELEKAKKKQQETEEALRAAEDRLKPLEDKHGALEKATKEEYEEYLAAKAAYEKQQEKLKKMEADLEVAEQKVRAIRDAEDRNGGVYPVRSSATSGSITLMLLLAAFAVH